MIKSGVALPGSTTAYAVQAAAAGTGWACGSNGFGQLGDGTTTDRAAPVPVAGLAGVVAVAAGSNFGLAARADGSVWAWGANGFGQLGDGTTTWRRTPVPVAGLSGVVAVAAGGAQSLALRADGSVWAWGANYHGELGDGTMTDRAAPVPVAGLAGVVAVAAGTNFSLAARADGTVWAWGANGFGQLGDGTATGRRTPAPVPGLTGVVAVAAGGAHALALRADGTLWAWGRNYQGELGDGTTIDRATPVRVGSLTGVVAAAAGEHYGLAATADGAVWAWGRNHQGQLGAGTTADRGALAPVPGLTGVVAVAAGDAHSLALRADGTLWAWGGNDHGQLGYSTGTRTYSPSPGPVGGIAGVTRVAGGAAHTLPVVATTPSPSSRELTVSTTGSGSINRSPAGSPGTTGSLYPLGTVVTLVPVFGTDTLFTGWTIDGVFQGWANPLTITMNANYTIVATFAARPTFPDVATTNPYYEPIGQLAARGIIRGYADGRFGPNDTTLRAQMAALIARAMGWDVEDHGNPFPDQGPVDADLWRNVGTLAYYGVARGYQDGRYRPTNPVLHVQVISFITRAMVARGYWQPVTADDPALYPNITAASGHRWDVLTYYTNAGTIPGTTPTAAWARWDQPATRAWFALAEWQALDSYWSVDRVA